MTYVQNLLTSSRSKRILVDTNLLALYPIGTFDRSQISTDKNTRSYTVEDFDLLKILLKNNRIIVTPNILTELSNLTSSSNENTKQRLFAYLGKLIEQVEEEYVPSVMVNNQVLRKLDFQIV